MEIYLHPEIEVMWSDSTDADQQTPLPNLVAVATAKQLLDDVRVSPSVATRHTVRI